uniref:mRNA capping enzyme adenylation domain-containing protein n=1 Tax=viral metagenome TaxID=1070528 RepID=A0A6C0DAE7_9ZZZZ
MELSQLQQSHLLKRLPEFELSYETISHNKVSNDYNIAFAIPTGKKGYVWFTFQGDIDVCYFMELNKDKKISKIIQLDKPVDFNVQLTMCTILYGSIILDENTKKQRFVIEDLMYYKGISMKKSLLNEKLLFLADFMKIAPNNTINGNDFVFVLPMIWKVSIDTELPAQLPDEINKNIGYVAHHIQYRTTNSIKPYLNVLLMRKLIQSATNLKPTKTSTHKFETIRINMDFNKPQYKYPAIFQVTADIQFDIYHLFAYGKNNMPVYYNVAYVPNYKSSIFLNGLFRNIRENKNLDYIEESDDEDDFQNMNEDKYVDINKIVLMECVFNHKFKRWTPVKVVDKYTKVVHLNKLVRDYY